MTADVFVLLDYALSRAYDCRRVRAAAATNTQTRMPADVCVCCGDSRGAAVTMNGRCE